MGKSTGRKLALGTIIAGAVGYIAGILTAPKSGKETRKVIKTTVDAGWSEAEKELKKLHTELAAKLEEAKAISLKVTGKAKEEVDSSLNMARDAKEKVREMLSAIHEGDAEDADLQHAIKQANSALSHVKNYLKK